MKREICVPEVPASQMVLTVITNYQQSIAHRKAAEKPQEEWMTRKEVYKDNILFRFTIGSVNTDILRFWEPNAPDYQERKKSLVYAFNTGYKTSISCEPMLDNNVKAIIDDLSEYVTDAIWLGKMNFAIRRLKTNGHNDQESLDAVCKILLWQSDDEIKKLYEKYKDNPKIKWKESIKKLLG